MHKFCCQQTSAHRMLLTWQCLAASSDYCYELLQVVLGRPIRVDVAEDRPERAQRSGGHFMPSCIFVPSHFESERRSLIIH